MENPTLLRRPVVPAGRQHLRSRPVRPQHQTPDKTMTVRTTLGAGDRRKLFQSRLKTFKSCLKVFRICLQMCKKCPLLLQERETIRIFVK